MLVAAMKNTITKCSTLIVNCGVVSPTRNVNPTIWHYFYHSHFHFGENDSEIK